VYTVSALLSAWATNGVDRLTALASSTPSPSPSPSQTATSGDGFFGWLFASDGFHPPSLADFFPEGVLFKGTIFEVNRITIIRILAAIVLVGIFAIIAGRARVVPRRGQALVEVVLDFVRKGIAEEVMGRDRGRHYAPFLSTLFLAVLVFNLMGAIPFLNLAATSLIGLPLVMALWVYLMYLGAGIHHHGLGRYLRLSLFPPGVPPLVYILLTPIEALQVFVLRPATLALRLTANMMAGHLLLVLCFSATQYFFFEASGAMRAMGGISLAAGFAFTLFEIAVAALQAYIFTVLSAVYLTMAIEEEH
jgi:F-type H+-transporting ATPase subunit a